MKYILFNISLQTNDICICSHTLKTPLDFHLNKHREENQLDATEMLYCPYNLLSMFRALVRQSSEARDYTLLFAPYGV